MRIRNNTVSNQSVYSSTGLGYMTVPGESTLELEDSVWLEQFASNSKDLLEAGNLEITKACKVSPEQQEAIDAKAIEAAKALIAKSEAAEAKKAKPKQG